MIGFGFHGNMNEPYKSIMDGMSKSSKPIISIDIPSGWPVDSGICLFEYSLRVVLISYLCRRYLRTILYAIYGSQLDSSGIIYLVLILVSEIAKMYWIEAMHEKLQRNALSWWHFFHFKVKLRLSEGKLKNFLTRKLRQEFLLVIKEHPGQLFCELPYF
jgi:YjeF-related protein N-terminus